MANNTISPLVSGWVGQGNFGDELLSYGLRLELRKAQDTPTVAYHGVGPFPVSQADDDARIERFSEARAPRLVRLYDRYLKSLSPFDLLVFGGGSILHSVGGVERKHQLMRRFRSARKRLQPAAGCIGVSIGPFANLEAERRVASFLSELDFIIVRDKLSADFATSAAAPGVLVAEARDLAFSVRAERPELFQHQPAGDRVGLSFLLPKGLEEDQKVTHLENMTAIVDLLVDRGHDVALIALHVGSGYRDDLLHETVRKRCRAPEKVSLEHFNGSMEAALRAVGSCRAYLSMRLHGVVTAFLCDIPALSLSTHPKAIEFSQAAAAQGREVRQLAMSAPIGGLADEIDHLLQGGPPPQYNPDADPIYQRMRQALVEVL